MARRSERVQATKPSVRPFSGTANRSYTENEEATRAPNPNPCVVCGRHIKEENERFFARVVYGGARWAMPDAAVDEYGETIKPDGDMGCFPVGHTCAKKLGPYAVKSEIAKEVL